VAGSVNKVILIGNLGKDPEVRRLENGGVVANFPMATTETYTDRATGERKEITDWHNIVVWRGLAEVVEKYVRKGTKLYVEGKLKTRSWTDKDGNTRYTTEVLADNLTMLSRSENNSSPQQNEPNYSSQGTPPAPSPIESVTLPNVPDETDDLPF
jgi:single-strand DNA-binding protein